MHCHKCGNEITEGTVFCPKCGTKVEANGGTNPQTLNASTQASTTNVSAAADTLKQMLELSTQKLITKKWWFWGIIVIIAIIVIFAVSGRGEDTGNLRLANNDNEVVEAGNETELEQQKVELGKKETMSAADIYVELAENDEFDYSVPEKSVAFIESNPQFFPGSDKNTGAMSDHVDWEADYPHVTKSPTKYADKLMNLYGVITDCEEIETEYGIITYLQVMDYSEYSYCMYYLGELEDAFEDNEVSGYLLPFDTITFENMGGYYTEAVMGAACYIDVYDYNYDETY